MRIIALSVLLTLTAIVLVASNEAAPPAPDARLELKLPVHGCDDSTQRPAALANPFIYEVDIDDREVHHAANKAGLALAQVFSKKC